MSNDMQVQITKHYVQNLGDHGAESIQAYTYDPDETVAEMVARVMDFPVSKYMQPDPAGFITVRVVTGTEPREGLPANDPFA